jgi:2-dehydro-3-deoxyphosphogluconate aldolase/(4S)-4-hydroxy-2-oxoglutarate aldolase
MSLSNHALTNLLADQKVMVILRNTGPEQSVALARSAWALGIKCVEVTLQSASDRDALSAVIEAGLGHPGAIIGAGTVTSLDDVTFAASAGAHFTVSPGLDLNIVASSHDSGLPSLPGVATPTEVQQALAVGLTWLKVFPAAHLGPSWVKTIRGPFPEAQFVATGGMTIANTRAMLAAGAKMVALGSALTDKVELAKLPGLLESLSVEESLSSEDAV